MPGGGGHREPALPIYGEGRVALWLFQVIGAELDLRPGSGRRRSWSRWYPTATWTLDLWEDEFAIPRDPTSPPPSGGNAS